MIVKFSIIGFPQPKVLINTFHLNVLSIIYYSSVDMVITPFIFYYFSIFKFIIDYNIMFCVFY